MIQTSQNDFTKTETQRQLIHISESFGCAVIPIQGKQ
jgi:hypothetical protein